MYTVKINDKSFSYDSPATLAEILKAHSKSYCAVAIVDGRTYELTKTIDYDCDIVPVGLTTEEGMRTYLRTLKFVFIMAARRLFPDAEVEFMYSLSKGQYCELHGMKMTEETTEQLEEEIKKIVSECIPIRRVTYTKEEMISVYEKTYPDKAKLISYRPESFAHAYECGDEINYLYGNMLPDTGYIKEFALYCHGKGIVMLYPRHDLNGMMPEYEETKKFNRVMREAERFGKSVGVTDINSLNEVIESGRFPEFVRKCEDHQNAEIKKMADAIAANQQIRLVLIAGPSSSGKTTLSDKLTKQLNRNGLKIVQISTDNYFKCKDELIPDENGEIDLEDIEVIDLDLFNKDLRALINGEEITLPVYNFAMDRREKGKTIKLSSDEVIVIEGTHGLNERLTSLIPRKNKYKIYISALTHINIDLHTPVSTTTCRMMRRIIRDDRTRGTNIEATLDMWASVRRGEFRWIYPFQEQADFIFNSELSYELAVIKKHVMPLVDSLSADSRYYSMANKIRRIMKYVLDADDDIVPDDSLLREFIGKRNTGSSAENT